MDSWEADNPARCGTQVEHSGGSSRQVRGHVSPALTARVAGGSGPAARVAGRGALGVRCQGERSRKNKWGPRRLPIWSYELVATSKSNTGHFSQAS